MQSKLCWGNWGCKEALGDSSQNPMGSNGASGDLKEAWSMRSGHGVTRTWEGIKQGWERMKVSKVSSRNWGVTFTATHRTGRRPALVRSVHLHSDKWSGRGICDITGDMSIKETNTGAKVKSEHEDICQWDSGVSGWWSCGHRWDYPKDRVWGRKKKRAKIQPSEIHKFMAKLSWICLQRN